MSNLSLEAELLALDFKHMLVKWGSRPSDRTGMHASAVLVSEKEWCTREQVLHELFPEQGEAQEWNSWDWKKSAIFENGWRLHQRWQDLFKKFGNVVYSPASDEIAYPDLFEFVDASENDLVEWRPELDLTHYDPERNLYFSPDAILLFGGVKYVVEIKGINADAYNGTPRDAQGNLIKGLYDKNGREMKVQEGLTDNLDQACRACETVAKALEQCNLYMHLIGAARGIILIENKNTCDFKVYVIEYNQERAWPYTNRINDVKGRLLVVKRDGVEKLPPRVCQSISDPRAKKCPMRTACFQEKKAVAVPQKQESEDW